VAPLEMNAGTCWGKNTIGPPRPECWKSPGKRLFTCFGQFGCQSSGIYSLYTQQWYMSYRFVDSFRAGPEWDWVPTYVKYLNCKLYYQQLHLKYWYNLARYWLQAVWGWHDSVETCSSVIICEIIVHLLVIVQNNKICMVQRIEIT
jgi:hypothetical protein